MNFRINVLLLFFTTISATSQTIPDFGDLGSHNYYVEQLNDSKDNDFQRTIGLYDAYTNNNPSDIIAQIERCKFIGNSYYDEYEGYNLKYEETEACVNQLYEKYPSVPAVLVYKAENLYGEERLEVLAVAEESIKKSQDLWSNLEKATIYRMLGEWHSENQRLALENYRKALALDTITDYSLPIAQILVEQDKKEEAKEILLPKIEKDTALWRMNAKASLLTQIGESDKAFHLYELISERDSTYINNQEMATLLSNMENYEVARSFLVKDTVYEWNRTTNLQKLFEHDLKHSSTEVALTTYRSLQKNNVYNDVLGIKRLRIFFKNPLLVWQFSELLHFSLTFIILLFLFVIPYVWILPVPYIGDWFKKRGNSKFVPRLNLGWNLRHFWIISFLYLTVQFILTLVFYYEDTINSFFEVASVYEEYVESDELLANGMLIFVLFMALATLAIVNKKNIRQVFTSNISIGKSIGLSIAFVIFNMMILKVLKSFIDFDEVELSNLILNPEAEIAATLRTYGFFVTFLCAAVLGPVYEEIIFRGAVLGSVEKHLGFITANIFQACLFAIIHFDIKLFIFYFIFGIITGMYVRKTGGLRTGIVLHIANNFFVLIVISMVT